MVTGFYAALAGAASVFIGILTALLASNLSSLNAQRERIEQRIETIDARLENLDNQREKFKDTIKEIKEQEEASQRREKAQEQVEEFIENHIKTELEIKQERLTEKKVKQEFKNYISEDNLNQEQHEVLQNRFDDIKSKLNNSNPLIETMSDSMVDSSIIATNKQIEHQWEIHTEERFNRNYRQWVQTRTEIRSLQDERKRLVNRHNSLDPSRILKSLQITVVTVIFSVVVPIISYFLRLLNIVVIQNLPAWIEPSIILSLWIIGLSFVFIHIKNSIHRNNGEVPGAPDTGVNKNNSNKSI